MGVGGSVAVVGSRRADPLGSQYVEVVVSDFVEAGQDRVEVVVDREMAAGEAVGLARSQPQDQLDGVLRSAPRPDSSWSSVHRWMRAS